MFTGIVERTATVSSLVDRPGSRLLALGLAERPDLPPWRPAVLGESIALNGVCLTVVEAENSPGTSSVSFEAVPETLHRTALGDLRQGDEVNLERSLSVVAASVEK